MASQSLQTSYSNNAKGTKLKCTATKC